MPFLYLKSRLTRSAAGFVLAFLIAVLGWFACLYSGLEVRKAAEREDAWALPVEVVITDLRGTRSDDLGVRGAALRAFTLDKGEYDNKTYILPTDLVPWFSEIRIKTTLRYSFLIWGDQGKNYHEFVGVTSLSAIDDFDTRLGTAQAVFFDGAPTDFAGAEEIILVPESALEHTQEDEDGRRTLSLEIVLDDSGNTGRYEMDAEVAGYYTGGDGSTIYCSWGYVARLVKNTGEEPFAESISATVADNSKLAELEEQLAYYFASPDPSGAAQINPHSYFGEAYRFAAVIHDETLRETLNNIDRSINTLSRLRPLVLALEVCISASAAFFYVHMRKRELAVARSLGTPMKAILFTLSLELLILCVLASATALCISWAMPLCTLSPWSVLLIDLAALTGMAAGAAKAAGKSGIFSLKEDT